jgi:hypothetical protein
MNRQLRTQNLVSKRKETYFGGQIMRKSLPLLAIAVLAFATPSSAIIMDQISDFLGAGFPISSAWRQEVTVGKPGPLLQLDLYVAYPGAAELSLTSVGDPWATTFTPDSYGWFSIDTSSAGLEFNVGDTFVIEIAAVDGSDLSLGGSLKDPGGDYGGGALWYDGQLFEGGDADIAFRTWTNVPEPATIAFLGLGGLALLRRRRAL